MNISTLLKAALLTTLLLAPLNAEEVNEEKCNNSYNLCTEKCEQAENSLEKCMEKCDDKYDKCLESAEEKTKDSN